MSVSKDKLGNILVGKGIITEAQLSKAEEIRKNSGEKLTKILVAQNFADEKKIMASLGEELGISPIDLTKLKLESDVVELVPQNVCEFYCVIPVAKIGNAVTVAMSDPLNVFAIDDIKLMTSMEIVPAIATETDILEGIKNYYSNKSGMTEVLDDVDDMELAEEKQEEMDLDQLAGEGDESPVIKIVNVILKEAIACNASDIHIEPAEKDVNIRYRIDGVLHKKVSPPKAMQNAIVSRLKIMAKLDIAERRLPQDGRFRIKFKGKNIDFRFSTLPCVFGAMLGGDR